MKYIEQLSVSDLKKVFRRYCESNLVANQQIPMEWKKFWARLKRECFVSESDDE